MNLNINPIFNPWRLRLSISVAVLAILAPQAIHAENLQMSVPASPGKQLTEVFDGTGAMSLPLPLSEAALKDLEKSINTDLDAGIPMAAAAMLDQFDPSEITDPAMKNRIIALIEKTSEALYIRGRSFPDNAALTRSISSSTKLLTLIDKSKEPGRLGLAQIGLGKALSVHGARFGDHPEMEKGIATLRTASKTWTMESAPERWAQAQLDLAEALIASARISETNEKFEEAIAVCQAVIDAQSNERLDNAATTARSVLSNALWQYGQRQNDAMAISEAEARAREALNNIDKVSRPLEWATTLNYLANANREYAFRTGNSELMTEAMNQYSQSLTIRTQEKYPLEWAQTQLDFGNALFYYQSGTQFSLDNDPAIEAYKKSLEVRTEKDTPLEWAMSQNNLASAASYILSAHNNSTADDRIDILNDFREALRITTRGRAPLDWALMKDNLGQELVKFHRAGQAARTETFDREMEAAMRAQESYPLEKGAELHQLTMAKLVEKFGATDEIDEALGHFEDILTLYTKERHPWRWLQASRRKAGVLRTLAMQNRNPIRMREVISIYREQQTLLQLRYDPVSWAQLEHQVAIALGTIGNITEDPKKLREAETAYLQAMEALPDKTSERMREINIDLARLRCDIGRMTSDKKTTQQAVAQYEEVNKFNKEAGLGDDIESINRAIKTCLGMPWVLSKADAERLKKH